jgi:hypothetical protein
MFGPTPSRAHRLHGSGSASDDGGFGLGRNVMLMQYRGLWGLVVLIADVWAIVNIMQSGAQTDRKVLWVVVVLVLPVIGVILWYLLGPKTGKA